MMVKYDLRREAQILYSFTAEKFRKQPSSGIVLKDL